MPFGYGDTYFQVICYSNGTHCSALGTTSTWVLSDSGVWQDYEHTAILPISDAAAGVHRAGAAIKGSNAQSFDELRRRCQQKWNKVFQSSSSARYIQPRGECHTQIYMGKDFVTQWKGITAKGCSVPQAQWFLAFTLKTLVKCCLA